MLKIISAPSPILAQKSKVVTSVNANVLKLIAEMSETLEAAKDPQGVGLAASQVGQNLQIFIAKPALKSKIQVFINPQVTANKKYLTTNKLAVRSQKLAVGSQKSEVTKLEGCLSLPNIWGEVMRFPVIKALYIDEKGIKHVRKFEGLMATIFQHEVDHLNGILFPKRVLEQKGILYKSHKNKKGEDEFEELDV